MSFPAWTGPCEHSKVEALRDPAVHADAPRVVEVIETHCSWVFLTTAFAYKMKKAMRLDLMDNRELPSRLRSCRQELSLNRRLAAAVYLEVVSLNRTDEGRLCFGGPGIAVEWLVKMKRLPAELLLDQALRAGSVRADAVDAVGGLLADFYARQPSIGMKPREYCARFEQQIESNGAALRGHALGLPPRLVEAVIDHQGESLQRYGGLLAGRARCGRIVEAHGDLKPEHVYLGTPPR